MSGPGLLLLVVAALCTQAYAQADGSYLEVALIGSAAGEAVGALPNGEQAVVDSFTATIAISSAGATASLNAEGKVIFSGGVTQLNATVQWAAGASPSARYLAFASELDCAALVAQNSATVYRVSSAEQEVQIDVTPGGEGVTSGLLTSMASIGDVQCIGIMRQGTVATSNQILAVGKVVVAEPKFPESFHATIDVNIRSKGYSFTLVESYDHENDVVRSDAYSAARGHFRIIQDYKDQKVIFIQPPSPEHENGRCTERDMDSKDPFVIEDGTHLATTQKFLGFSNSDVTPLYLPYLSPQIGPSDSDVRGVPVDIWQYDFGNNGSNYKVDFSFAVPQWRTERNWTEARPLRRIRLTGSKTNGATTTYVDHTYDYVGFQPGLPDWVTFDPCQILPGGTDCRCIPFLRSTGTEIDTRGECPVESDATFVLAGVIVGAITFSCIWLLLFWFCAGLTLCNLKRNGHRGTHSAKDLEMAPTNASDSPTGPPNLADVKFEDLSGELPNQ